VLLALAPMNAGQLQNQGSPPVQVLIDGIDLVGAEHDRVLIEVRTHVISVRTLSIQRIRFERVRLGSVPVYLSPIDEQAQLTATSPPPLRPIHVTVYFRDLDSLAPFIQAVENGSITVPATTRIDLDLPLLERLLLRDMTPHADMPIEVSIPVVVPGGVLAR